MQTNNPFELILYKLAQLRTTVDIIFISAAIRKKLPESTAPNRIINLAEPPKIPCRPLSPEQDYIHSKELPAKLIGEHYLIRYSQIMQWFEAIRSDAQTKMAGITP